MSIRLHSTLGLNPRLTICPICMETGDDLMILGSVNAKYKCPDCGAMNIGLNDGCCCKCGNYIRGNAERTELRDDEKINLGHPCRKCEDLMKQGIIFRVLEDGAQKKIIAEQPYGFCGIICVREDAVKRWDIPEKLKQEMIRKRVTNIELSSAKHIGLIDAAKQANDIQAKAQKENGDSEGVQPHP